MPPTPPIATIPLFQPIFAEDAIAAAAAVMRSGWIGMGPQVEAFEREFLASLGLSPATAAAIATNSGTAALHLAFRLLDLPPGAQVITTPNTFVATNQVLLWENLTPVFADIDPATGNIDPRDVARKITPQTRALLIVHFAGNPCDLDALHTIARAHDLPIVEDAAHACGAAYHGRPVGAHGNLTAFSFGPTKNLTTGDGGMLILPNPAHRDRAAALRNLGISSDTFQRIQGPQHYARHWQYDVPTPGLRYHMNDIAAAIGRVHLRHLPAANAHRAALAARYRERLADVPGIRLPSHFPDTHSAHYLFFILAEHRDRLADALLARGITVSLHYRPNDRFPIFQPAHLPHAESFYADQLSLPLHPHLTDEQLETIVQSIKAGW